MSVVYSGLLDRHPNLRIMFTQGGGWIHFGIGRLDHRYKQRADARPMASPPADYLSRMYFDCLVHDEDTVSTAADPCRILAEFLAGTDFPATGDIPGGAMRWIGKSQRLSTLDKQRILWRNAFTFLGLYRAGNYTAELELPKIGPRQQ